MKLRKVQGKLKIEHSIIDGVWKCLSGCSPGTPKSGP